jgi:hypothetical protein
MSRRRTTAIHEAGHAVASIVFGREVDYVSIRRGKGFNGIACSVPRPRDVAGYDPVSVLRQPSALRADVERDIVVLLAGELAALAFGSEPAPARYDEDEFERVATDALAALGPRVAELVIKNEASDEVEYDRDGAIDLAMLMTEDVLAASAYFAWLEAEARAFVAAYRATILRVADALEEHAVRTGEHVARLVYPHRAPKGAEHVPA